MSKPQGPRIRRRADDKSPTWRQLEAFKNKFARKFAEKRKAAWLLAMGGQLRTTVKRRIAAGRAGEPYLSGITPTMARNLRRQGRKQGL